MPAAAGDVLDVAADLGVRRACASFSSSAKPRIEFSGVRSSWLTLARNSLLSRLDSYRARFDSAICAELQVQALVDRAELVLALLQVGQHLVERLGEHLELIAGADVRADVEVALGDLLGGLLQHADGLEDQPLGDAEEER